ncbi:two pore domain potassium channel family protein [Vallicoccus soli]|uniref:Two pore domain potassium channel family protein n=2 Tax=Vallicoccus soli TaxID=2339232 RepID=A0A3A3YUG6_9ACTN|nr:two pore domain potassium channel family protein [Vallicoccus soli]
MVADVLVCGWLYALLEGKGPVEGPWWGIVTGTTTGYGDFYPSTTAGRGVAAFLMVSMILLTACLTAQLTAHLIPDPNVFTHEEQEQIKAQLAAVEAKLDALLQQREGSGPPPG